MINGSIGTRVSYTFGVVVNMDESAAGAAVAGRRDVSTGAAVGGIAVVLMVAFRVVVVGGRVSIGRRVGGILYTGFFVDVVVGRLKSVGLGRGGFVLRGGFLVVVGTGAGAAVVTGTLTSLTGARVVDFVVVVVGRRVVFRVVFLVVVDVLASVVVGSVVVDVVVSCIDWNVCNLMLSVVVDSVG